MEAVRESQTKRRSFISRLRSTKSEKVTKADATSEAPTETEPVVESDETRHPSPSTGAQPHPATVTREGVPIISAAAGTDHSFKPSDVRQNRKFTKKGVKVEKKSILLAKAPAARDSAFSGPPRYDWIDIVSALLPSFVALSITTAIISGFVSGKIRLCFLVSNNFVSVFQV